jgi:osmotically-inducible protein OsmY
VKTDSQIQIEITDAISQIDANLATAIAVAVRAGVVSLDGEVSSLAKRTAAGHAASTIRGVVSVANDIVVRLPEDQRRTDVDIAEDAVDALIKDTDVPDKTIKVRVQDRWIWLVGEAETEHQRRAAEHAVENIPGVKGISNVVRLTPSSRSA